MLALSVARLVGAAFPIMIVLGPLGQPHGDGEGIAGTPICAASSAAVSVTGTIVNPRKVEGTRLTRLR
jgi:hypothetical protein